VRAEVPFPSFWVTFWTAPPAAIVKVCGCRPHEGGAARTGPASANLQRRKPREVWRDDASDAEGIWRL
jgi:hypothetical protein